MTSEHVIDVTGLTLKEVLRKIEEIEELEPKHSSYAIVFKGELRLCDNDIGRLH